MIVGDADPNQYDDVDSADTHPDASLEDLLDEDTLLDLEIELYQELERHLCENPLQIMHEKFEDTLGETFVSSMADVLISRLDDDTMDGVVWEEIAEFVQDRINVYVTTMMDPPRSFHDQEIPTMMSPEKVSQIAARMAALNAAPQPAQRTPAWYEFRHNLLTATDVGKVLGTSAERNSVIYEKCIGEPTVPPITPSLIQGQRVNLTSPLHWGVKYEPVTLMLYEKQYHTQVAEFGCLRHDHLPWLAASPDGINVDPASPRYGRMVEIKNIVNREITGIPLTKYWIQTQIQMEVCDLDLCDFVETRFLEYPRWDMVFEDPPDNARDRGVVLRFSKKHTLNPSPEYVYMPLSVPLCPDTVRAWMETQQSARADHFILEAITAWYLDAFSCVVIPRNRAWFQAACPLLLETWTTIERERVEGYAHREPKRKASKWKGDVVPEN